MRIPVLIAFVALFLTGCQCCRLSEPYADLIDDISDRPVTLDALYNPELDLQRIGKPDWCRSRLNRWLCRGRDCCSGGQGGYDPHFGWPQGAAAHPSRPADLPPVPAPEPVPELQPVPAAESEPETTAPSPAAVPPAPPASENETP